MKAEQRTVFISRDGVEHRTKALCLAYERKTAGAALVGLTKAQVEAARTGKDPELAEVFVMFVGEMRNSKRRGDRPIDRSTEPSKPNGPTETPPTEPEPGAAGVGLEDGRTEAANG
jgi:hypothetical protein